MSKHTGTTRAVLLASASFLIAGAAAAQETDDASNEDEIVVIGSYIGGVADSGALPVTVVDREQLDLYGSENTGDLMANIPAVGDFEFRDNNTGTNGARGDVSGVNLRGLGSGRTLVLLNGRRVTTHPASEAVSSVPVTFFNVNVIPAPMINRVEVLRDGASALYGADAIAGVVNYSLYDDFDGGYGAARYGASTEHSLTESSVSLRWGSGFNNNNSHFTFGANYYTRSDVAHTELDPWFSTLDRRTMVPPPFAGDTDWDNRSTIGPYARLTVGGLDANNLFQGQVVRCDTAVNAACMGGTGLVALTGTGTSAGLIHMQPASFAGTRYDLGGVGIDDGAQERDLRYDFIMDEIAIPEIERYSLAGTFTQDLGGGFEFFAEGLYYNSNLRTARAPGPTDRSLAYIIVPAQNYYNPFGPIGSPNRIPGIDAPAGGLDVLIEGYRPIEHGPRVIVVDQEMWRALGGLRGDFGAWSWESAFGYSEATSSDEEFNRISKTLLQAQLELTTPDAFNVFGGPGANSQAVLDAVRISSIRYAESRLGTWDFRATNNNFMQAWGGAVAAAWGVEYRNEYILDDSDPRLDGTMQFTNGAVPDESDVVGVSATNDFDGSRDVWSVYGELVVPIVGDANRMPLVHALDLQLAGRFESFSDFGDIFKPKIALHYYPMADLSLRASYAEGFRAPNLVQLNQGTITRRAQGDEDPIRAPVIGSPNDVGDTYRPSLRFGNPDLEPEESTSFNIGLIYMPRGNALEGLRASVDFWRLETENAIENFGVQEQLNLDLALRQAGGSNPNVIRAPITAADQAAFDAYNLVNPGATLPAVGEVTLVLDGYINLSLREVEGIDYAISYDTPDFSFGSFNLGLVATNLLKYEEAREANVADQIARNGNPEWRVSANVGWRYGPWTAAAQARWVSSFVDTSANTGGQLWEVSDWTTVNLLLGYEIAEGTQLRIGARNVFNELPPHADESPGYYSGVHNVEGRVVYGQISHSF